jgi:hypothetical protein
LGQRRRGAERERESHGADRKPVTHHLRLLENERCRSLSLKEATILPALPGGAA